eukprot:55527-Prymnesium_polylepis.1
MSSKSMARLSSSNTTFSTTCHIRVRLPSLRWAHGAKADGTEDVRLVLLGEGDALGVAAALDVEDSSLGPHVLVIADELAPRVGRERCLTCHMH